MLQNTREILSRRNGLEKYYPYIVNNLKKNGLLKTKDRVLNNVKQILFDNLDSIEKGESNEVREELGMKGFVEYYNITGVEDLVVINTELQELDKVNLSKNKQEQYRNIILTIIGTKKPKLEIETKNPPIKYREYSYIRSLGRDEKDIFITLNNLKNEKIEKINLENFNKIILSIKNCNNIYLSMHLFFVVSFLLKKANNSQEFKEFIKGVMDNNFILEILTNLINVPKIDKIAIEKFFKCLKKVKVTIPQYIFSQIIDRVLGDGNIEESLMLNIFCGMLKSGNYIDRDIIDRVIEKTGFDMDKIMSNLIKSVDNINNLKRGINQYKGFLKTNILLQAFYQNKEYLNGLEYIDKLNSINLNVNQQILLVGYKIDYLRKLKKFEDAIEYYETLDNTTFDIEVSMGYIYMEKRDGKKAFEIFKGLLSKTDKELGRKTRLYTGIVFNAFKNNIINKEFLINIKRHLTETLKDSGITLSEKEHIKKALDCFSFIYLH